MYRIKSIFNVFEFEPTTIDKIVEEIGSKEMLDKTMPVRHAKDKNEADAIKRRTLPAFTLCKMNGRIDSQGFISTDILYIRHRRACKRQEGGAMITAEDALAKVKPFAVFAFVSPSGKGIKFVIKLDRAVNLNEYRYNRSYYREIFHLI
jgi:hypothetical protein